MALTRENYTKTAISILYVLKINIYMQSKSRYEIYLEGIKNDILENLKEEDHTIESLRIKVRVNWKTVRDRLRLLQNAGIVCKKRVGKTRIFYLNPDFKKEEQEP